MWEGLEEVALSSGMEDKVLIWAALCIAVKRKKRDGKVSKPFLKKSTAALYKHRCFTERFPSVTSLTARLFSNADA
jgi:hypothetical protein